jgi:predicted nucleotidyltransferase
MLDISRYKTEIMTLCSSLNVKELYLFGSALSVKYSADSDIDLLVNFKNLSPSDYTKNYFALKFSLEELLGKEIDLLEQKSLSNPYLKSEIDSKKQLLYAA